MAARRAAPSRLHADLARRILRTLKAEGAGHAVHEDRPEWFEHAVVDWLKRVSAGPARV